MGDRANVFIKDTGVYLYTHWCGEELPHLVQKALAKHRRWDDEAYLTRIIFETMVGKEHGTDKGFGISNGLVDNEYAIVVVEVERGRVYFAREGDEQDKAPTAFGWTFADYIKLSGDEINHYYMSEETSSEKADSGSADSEDTTLEKADLERVQILEARFKDLEDQVGGLAEQLNECLAAVRVLAEDEVEKIEPGYIAKNNPQA